MASAPGLSAILIIFPGIISLKNNFKKLIIDKWNFIFIFASILMPLITLIQSEEFDTPPPGLIIPLLNNWDKSLSWIGLTNWIPLFFSFIAFQSYVTSEKDRIIFSKCLIAGSFPLFISGFSQLIFGLYGPFTFLNGFIIWFQKPIEPLEGISSVFSNQNYAGAWFCILFPLCLAAYLDPKNTKFSKYISFTFLILIASLLVLTGSRGAWLGLISFIPLILGISSLIWILPIIFLVFILIMMANGYFVSSDIKEIIRSILPRWFWLKFASEHYTIGLSRYEIWQQSIFLISQKPLFGWGAAVFSLLYYSLNKVLVQHSHNLVFELAISYGIPFTILIFSSIFLISISSFFNLYGKNSIKDENLYDRAWFSSFIVLLLIQLVDIQYYDGRISLIFWILLAGLKQLNKSKYNLRNYNEPLPTDQ